MAPQREEGFDLLPSGRSGDDEGGFAQFGPAGEGEAGIGKQLKIGQRRGVRVVTEIERCGAEQSALEMDGRARLTTIYSDWLKSEVEREGLRERIGDGNGNFGVGFERALLAGIERHPADECVVEAHLQAGARTNGNGVKR